MARALLVIDMLRDFLDEDGALSIGDAKQIIRNVAKRTEEWRASGNPVIYILDRHLPDDAEFKMFPPHCLAGERGGEVVDELAPREGDIRIYKRRYSAFFGTDLDLTLRELGVTEVELAGVCTQICILYTAADARMLNYEVTVRRECVASFDEKAHEFALQEMEKTLGVKVL
ncbi:MAG: isochorismatase family cysteine hydrolase [Bacillota bacterium]|nr:isochorismatase family cysteine hydrolase [Bacillota bacterium]